MRRVALAVLLVACSADALESEPPPDVGGRLTLAGGCFTLALGPSWLARAGEDGYAAVPEREAAEPFRFQAADLGTYLLYDVGGGHLVADDEGVLLREEQLLSDVLLIDDAFLSPAEWDLEDADGGFFTLRQRRSGLALGEEGLVENARIALHPAEGCAVFPELSLDAEVSSDGVRTERFEDGSVFGIVDTHSHILSNFAFGGGGLFHGGPFHRLGVEHALPDCALFHGEDGRQDLFGFGFDAGDDLDATTLLTSLVTGRLSEPNHATDGWPTFSEWPSAPFSSTHQTQYWKWLERAYLGGLRLVVQHATSNRIICEMTVGAGIQSVRYSCDDMVAVDRILEETLAMERYIDAQAGGPGQGFFRIVRTPAEAREVIDDGKLAVVLGIEVSNLFDCRLTPRPGEERCDEATVLERLDRYRDLGVRAIFPIHKYDNAFGSGDGDRNIIELGAFINSGHWSNYTQTCPDVRSAFDRGPLQFGGLNMPREDFLAEAPNDFSGFIEDPVGALAPFLGDITGGALEGDWCLNAGMTPLGMALVGAMMDRGMILEIDHLGRRAYVEVLERLEEEGYPAAGTHGGNQNGRVYAIGGISKTSFRGCGDPDRPGAMIEPILERAAAREAAGFLGAEGFGFDLNGFAGGRRPRFGERSRCENQANPMSYPFTSVDGRVTFTRPRVGERELDFDTEGMAHLGLLPELIQDALNDGASAEDLEPLFKSAEGYLQMWELAEQRAAERAAR
ncbi:MAG: hypothetical protein AAGH15_03780 [Myxococcota bacterium]